MTAASRVLRVLEPGLLTTVQDDGRPGYAHLGVPRSGWLDPPSAGLANRLVGNEVGAAVLECLLGGLVLEAGTASTLAVTGAACDVAVDTGRGRRPAPHGAAVTLLAGDRLVLGRATRGARCYVAVSGGIVVAPVLGSRSTDTLSGLGPSVLAVGTVLEVGPPRGEPSGAAAVPAPHGGSVTLHCEPGPRVDWFRGDVLATLAAGEYVVEPDSDRVALRLRGAALERAVDGELPSEGLLPGAVQVPADGQPVVFLRDHPTTGGYPVAAVVDPADVAACGQLLPGDVVRFRPARRDGGAVAARGRSR